MIGSFRQFLDELHADGSRKKDGFDLENIARLPFWRRANARGLLHEAIAGGDNTAVRALIALDHDKAWPFLLAQLVSPRLENDDLVRMAIVAEAVAARHADASIRPVLAALLGSRLSFVRTKAVAIAGEWPVSIERVALLKGYLESDVDADRPTRRMAATALMQALGLPPGDGNTDLLDTLCGEDRAARMQALHRIAP